MYLPFLEFIPLSLSNDSVFFVYSLKMEIFRQWVRNMKICFFTNVSLKEEFETKLFLKNDIRAIRELGYEVVPCNKWRHIPKDAGLVYAWFWTYGGFKALLASRFLGVPILSPGNLHYSDPGPQNFSSLPLIKKFIKRISIRSMDLLLSTSQREYNDLRKHFVFKAAKLVYHGVDCPEWKTIVPLGKRKDIVLTIAFLNSYGIVRKRIMTVIKCAEIIQKRSLELKFYIIGRQTKNNQIEKVQKYIREKGITNVIFTGHISNSEKENLLRSAKYYLQPTVYEGFGVAIAEAMSYGIPVLTSKVPSVDEVVGNAGVYSADENEFADAIERLERNSSEWKELSRKGYNRVRVKFSYRNRKKLLNDAINYVMSK